jgi:hypothetical protein
MTAQLPDGTYQFEAQAAFRLLTDFDGVLAATRQGDAAASDQLWAVANGGDGTATLRCVGSGRYLALAGRSGPYYRLGLDPEPWRLGRLDDTHELIRASTDRRLWLSGLYLLDATPVLQQGVEQDVIPTRWLAHSTEQADT